MKNFTYFTHDAVPEFVAEITQLWNVYGKTVHTATRHSRHDLVNITPVSITNTMFGKWITSEIGEIDNCKFFICEANMWGETHIDGGTIPRNCAINIPIANCETGVMNWFSNRDLSNSISTSRTNVHISKFSIDTSYWNSKDSMILTHPALVRTNCWHNVDNRLNSNPRIVLSIRLKNNPQFEDILDKIKPWAI